jgi:hypothetical protein
MAANEDNIRHLVAAALTAMEDETKRIEASADDVVSAGATLCAMLFDGALAAGSNPQVVRTAAEIILMHTAHGKGN